MTNNNIETRTANRLKSIFSAFGQVINDFYLEAGIYFVGGFNAALVAWDIYTNLLLNGQPFPYAIALAIIAFIAVEGLAVYLVGAAAKTNNSLLWFFSVVFASFFTYAHYREMSTGGGVIAQYITLAIPFFVVIGYWARTVKVDIETDKAEMIKNLKDEKERKKEIEDQERAHKWEIQRLKLEQKQALQMAQVSQKSVSSDVPEVSHQLSHEKTLETLKQEILAELDQEKPNMTQLALRLNIGRGTLYRHLGTLAETGEVIKNGNGYELPK